MKRKTKEEYIREKVDKHIDIIISDLFSGRHISAIISTIGIIYESEHKIARDYLEQKLRNRGVNNDRAVNS